MEVQKENKVKRLCLFAGYDSKGVILKYVIHYVKAMSELADVYYMADCEMAEDELSKLTPYTKEHYALRHKKYDFGSWQELILRIGWDKVAEYDELILCNDSCFAPLNNSLPYIFEKASNDDECDFWGASSPLKNQHLQSYFLVFKKNVFISNLFKDFINNITEQKNKNDICLHYEIGLTNALVEGGFKPKQIIDILGNVYDNWNKLIKLGFPFLKNSILFSIFLYNVPNKPENNNKLSEAYIHSKNVASVKNIDNFIQKNINYDYNMIEEYISQHELSKELFCKTSFKYDFFKLKIRIKYFRRHRIYWHVYKNPDRKLLRILGKNIYNKSIIKPLLTYKELKELSGR